MGTSRERFVPQALLGAISSPAAAPIPSWAFLDKTKPMVTAVTNQTSTPSPRAGPFLVSREQHLDISLQH